MLSVLGTWAIVTLLAFPIGFCGLQIITKRLHYEIRYLSSYIVAGLVFLTVYAQIFSLFSKVSAVAFFLLIPIALASFIFQIKHIKEAFTKRRKPIIEWILLFIGILLFSYASSRGYMAYDTSLYHAQAIRWIEEYGVVKGLALFHFRLGYNSAAFALSALFSFSWTGLQPMHCMAGYFLLLLFTPCIKLYEIVRFRKLRFSDFIRIGIFYYITLVLFEVVAPASDFFATSMVFFLVYRYATLTEEDTGINISLESDKNESNPESHVPYALLSVLALYAITLKFSAGLMVLIVIKPLITLIKEKKWLQIIGFISLGLIVLLPTLIRGYLISGWPLYPSTMLGFLHPDWQVPAELAARDAAEIKYWGQRIPELGNYNATFTEWFPFWFKAESLPNKGFLILDAVGILLTFTAFPFFAFSGKLKEKDNKKRKLLLSLLLLSITISASFFLWFSAAPLVRYGYAFVILPGLCALGFLYLLLPNKASASSKIKGIITVAVCLIFAAFILYKGVMVGKDAVSFIRYPYYFTAMPYEEYPTESYTFENQTFYKPVSGDQTGYEKFPAGPYEFYYSLRGNTLKDGFTTKP